jgi:hypothetical protein
MIDTGKQNTKTKLQIFKPDINHVYNQYIGGGGGRLVDQVMQAYPSMRKTIKWHKKIVLHTLDITVFWRALDLEKK